MDYFTNFTQSMDWGALISFLTSAVVALLCITVHEVAHGFVAWRLGDPTAKNMGRLTLNPIPHIDLIGLLMMVTVHVGWAKPVPVDMRYFKNPKRDMALTALAGPASNFIMALVTLFIASAVYHVAPVNQATVHLLMFLCYTVALSVGLGLFNLLPIPPLDGSKIFFSLFPDRIYIRILRNERFIMLAVLLLVWSGLLSGPLSMAMSWVVQGLCAITQFPFQIFYFFGLF